MYKKIICVLILFIENILFTQNLDFYIKENYFSFGYNKNFDDDWLIFSKLNFNFHINQIFWVNNIKFIYNNLGLIDIVENQQVSYRNIQNYELYKIGLNLKTGISFNSINVLLNIEYIYYLINNYFNGNIYYNLNYGFEILWEEIINDLFINLKYENKFIYFELLYGLNFYLYRINLKLLFGYIFNNNNIIMPGVGLVNYNKDLRIYFFYKIGINYNLYENFYFTLEKKYGNFGFKFWFSPSFIGNNLFGSELIYYYGEEK